MYKKFVVALILEQFSMAASTLRLNLKIELVVWIAVKISSVTLLPLVF
jgi:hypothetical protein